jgi:hypothetical protein
LHYLSEWGESPKGDTMALRDRIENWARRTAPLTAGVILLLLAAALILAVPARGAAAVLGIIAGAALSYAVVTRARYPVQLALLWSAIAVTADAAYARLNDQAPVTLANLIAKIIDACLKLMEPLLKGLGITADPRLKVAAVSAEFTWGLILTLIVLLLTGFPWRARGRP